MIEKLEILLALARERHFGRAAEACGVSQPTLSSTLKSLEEQLGVTLVERGSRFRCFTPEGERVLDWARRIVGDARAMRQEIDGSRRGFAGHLRLGVIPTALPFAPELTMAFKARHDGASITVVSATSDTILSGLDNLEFDAGISYVDTEPLQRYQTLSLYEERYQLLVAPDSPLASRNSITWSECNKLPLCLLTPDMQNRRIVDRHLAEAGGPSVGATFESNSMTMLHVHVLTGKWATISAIGEGERFAPPMQLKAVPIIEPSVTHRIGLVIKNRDPHPPVVAAFLNCVRRVTADTQRLMPV